MLALAAYRRTARGGVCALLHPEAAGARSLTRLEIGGDAGTWDVTAPRDNAVTQSASTPPGRPTRGGAFVIRGVGKSISPQKFLDDFSEANCRNFGLPLAEFRAKLTTARRLDRRLPSGPQAGTWAPSSSMLVEGDPSLVARLLAAKTGFFAFRAVEIRPYELPERRCYHCGGTGHIARHCRSACLFCGHRHPTRDCPSGNQVLGRSLGSVRDHSAAGSGQHSPDAQPGSPRPSRGRSAQPGRQTSSPAPPRRPRTGEGH